MVVSVVALYYMHKQREEWCPSKINFDYKGYSTVFQFAFFGWLSLFLTQALILSSQLIINNRLDLSSVGIYTAAGIFTVVLTVLKGGFCTYWSAFMYKNYDDRKQKYFILEMHDVVLFFCIIFCAVMFSCRSIIYLFIGEEFRSSKPFFTLLLYFPLLQTVQETTGYGISIMNKNHILSIIMFISLCINIILGLTLIDDYGLFGVAWGSFISAVISFILGTFFAQRYYESIPNIKRTVIGFIILLAEGVFPVFITDDRMLIIILCVLLFVSAWLYKNTILKFYNLLINKY